MASKTSSNFFSTIHCRSPDQALLIRPTLKLPAQTAQEIQQDKVDDIACEKFVPDGAEFRFRQVQPAHDCQPSVRLH